MLYTAGYLTGVMWLSLRLSTLYPEAALAPLDPALCCSTIAIYLFGLISPLMTMRLHWEELTETERLRMKGMVASGAVGAGAACTRASGPPWLPLCHGRRAAIAHALPQHSPAARAKSPRDPPLLCALQSSF